MAIFDEKSGEILLSTEDKAMFRECGRNMEQRKTPTANAIMRAILPEDLWEVLRVSPKYD